MTGNENNRNLDLGIRQFALKIQPAGAGQPHIQDETTRLMGEFALKELLG